MGIPEDREMLLSSLEGEGRLRTPDIIEAFREVPREAFVRDSDTGSAYKDYPLPIGRSQTISAPHMVAEMTELLKPRRRDAVLEIGAGSGYQACILSRLVSSVHTIEIEPELAEAARKNLAKAGCGNVTVIEGDGSYGYPPAAPYDKIIVTCATPEIFQTWKDQLRPGGILIAPVGGYYHQDLLVLKKKSDGFEESVHGGCIFVPLRKEVI